MRLQVGRLDNRKMDAKKKSLKQEKKAKEMHTGLENRVLELEDQLKRAVADYKNLERRFIEEKRETIRYANKELIINLLPALDALFLAGKYTQDQGVKLTVQRIIEVLKENGVEKVVTENVKYNAETMECVEIVEGTEGEVVEEIRPGFTINGKLIRAAQVKVGKADQ
jgi:molecular chaperone GrpE